MRPWAAHHPRGTAASWGQGLFCSGYFGGPFCVCFCVLSCLAFSPLPPRSPATPVSGRPPRHFPSHGFTADPSRRPPATCPGGCKPALPRGLLPPHLAKPRRGTGGLRRGCVGRRDGATGPPGHSPEQRRGPLGAPRREEQAVRPLLLFCPLPPVISKATQRRGKAGWEGGADRRPGQWPPRGKRSLPSSASRGWRTWGGSFNSLGCWGGRVFPEGAEGKEVPVRCIVVYIHFIGKKNLYIKISWQTVKSIHKCKYILLLKQ